MEPNPQYAIKSLLDHTPEDLQEPDGREKNLFMNIALSEMNALGKKQGKFLLFDKPPEEQMDPAVTRLLQSPNGEMPRLIFARLKEWMPEAKVTTHLFSWLSMLSQKPAIAIMWAHVVFELWKMQPVDEPISTAEWVKKFQKMPTNDFARRIWYDQKRKTSPNCNLLDDPEFWRWMRTRPNKEVEGKTSA